MSAVLLLLALANTVHSTNSSDRHNELQVFCCCVCENTSVLICLSYGSKHRFYDHQFAVEHIKRCFLGWNNPIVFMGISFCTE